MRTRILPFTLMLIPPGSGSYFQFDADPETDPTTHFFPDLDLTMLQNDPLRLPPFHFDADPDPAFHCDADRDPACHFDADPDPASPK
jgi:hypothetical protein